MSLSLLLRAIVIAVQMTHGGNVPEEHFYVTLESSGLKLFLRHQPTTQTGPASERPPVLILHGSTLPSALSAANRIDGESWMDDLAKRGFDVWALDFLGFGGSDRYREMTENPTTHAPLGRAREAVDQVAAAVNFILAKRHASRIEIIAHSWGTIPAGIFTARSPKIVDRLVQFGPVVTRNVRRDTTIVPAWSAITPEDRLAGLAGLVPAGVGAVLEPAYAATFAASYLASDPGSSTRTPHSIALPSGPDADLLDMWSGVQLYDPEKIVVPVLIIRGEWDSITTDADARRLFDQLRNTVKRDVKISRATHVMQLEQPRHQLYAEVASFLTERFATSPNP
jgi:pimeloyl-ACP methyl ester carboxylesterase